MKKFISIFIAISALTGITAAAESGTSGNLTWTFNNGTLIVSGTGDMDSFDDITLRPWDDISDSVTKLVIEDGVTSIGDNAFSAFDALVEVILGQDIEYIGNSAFLDCPLISDITIPDSTTIIDANAFAYCSSLSDISLGNGISEIWDFAFYDCTSLNNLTIPTSLYYIGDSVFCDCTLLSDITVSDDIEYISYDAFLNTGYYNTASNWTDNALYLGSSLIAARKEIGTGYEILPGTTSIASGVFYEFDKLETVIIPDSTVYIGTNVFYGCSALKGVIIGNGVREIDSYMFYDCPSLEALCLGSSIEKIGDYAFSYCPLLTDINIPESVKYIGYDIFYGCDSLTDIYYSGSSTQWKEISGYENIPETINIRCGDNPLLISKVSETDTGFNLTVNDTPDGCVVYAALYSIDGRLNNVYTAPLSFDGSADIELKKPDSGSVKFFVWQNSNEAAAYVAKVDFSK